MADLQPSAFPAAVAIVPAPATPDGGTDVGRRVGGESGPDVASALPEPKPGYCDQAGDDSAVDWIGEAPGKLPRVSSLQRAYRLRNLRLTSRVAADPKAAPEERLYANYLAFRLGKTDGLEAYVREFPSGESAQRRLVGLAEVVASSCRDVECIDTQMVLGCAAARRVPKAAVRLFQHRRVADGGGVYVIVHGIVWATVSAPTETLRAAVCTRSLPRLVEAIGYGVPAGKRLSTIDALMIAKVLDPAAQAAKDVVMAALARARERELGNPCDFMSSEDRVFPQPGK